MALQFKTTTGATTKQPTRSGGLQFKSNVPQTYQKEAVQQESRLDKFGLPKATLSVDRGAGINATEPQKESFWKKAAKAILPKSLEDLFNLNETETVKNIKKSYEQAYAFEDLQRLQKKLEAGGGKLEKETAGEVMAETPVEKYLPFVSAIPEIVNYVQLYQSAKRVERGEDTFVDQYRLAKYKAEQEQDKTFGAKVASILTELPSFGGELLLTGGIYTAGKKATEKVIKEAAEKAVGKKLGTILAKSAGAIVGGTLQTVPARFTEITAGAIENMIPEYSFEKSDIGTLQPVINEEGDNVWKAAIKSLGDQWVEVVSEHSGGLFTEAFAPVRSKLVKLGILKSFLKLNPQAGTSGFMQWVKRAGWNGVLAEMGEERIGEIMRGGLTALGLSEEGYKLPTAEQLAVELVSFSIPGVMINATNKALGKQNSFGEAVKPTPLTINEAENVVAARDITAVSRGAQSIDENAITELNSELKQYNEEAEQYVFEANDKDFNNLINIKVIPYPDGKWGFSYGINVGDVSVISDFTSNKLSAKREEAVAKAQTETIKEIEKRLKTIKNVGVKDKLTKFVDYIKDILPENQFSVEVREETQEAKEKREGIKALEPTAREEAKNLIRTEVYRGDTLEQIRAGQSGQWGADVKMSIGGTWQGKRTATDKIVVYEINGKQVNQIFSLKEIFDELQQEKKTGKTQKEKVAEAIKEKPKTIKEVAEETKILEPNVRRILGMGAKEGAFERVDKGVYILKKGDKQIAYIHTGDAIEVLPKLAKDGLKADMVFLDIPYKTPAVIGGNRGIKYDYITPEQFKVVVDAVKEIARYDSTPVFYMYSQARSGEKEMQKYTDIISGTFKPVARGEYTKLQLDGVTRVRNMRGDVIEPEGILLLTKDGTTNLVNPNLNFKLIRPRGYQTEKPAEMIKALIEMSTKEGEVVLDPFAGSGVVPAEAVKAGREAVAIEKSEKAVEENIKPRVEEAAKVTGNMSLDLTSKIFELRKKAIIETETEAPARKRGQLRPDETSFDRELKLLNRQFGKEIYSAYKSKYGEYPIGFISLSDSPFEWKNEKQGSILFDVAQAETDQVETQVAENLDDILTTLRELKSRGRSSEIIQSDIQYDIERTRPTEKPKIDEFSGKEIHNIPVEDIVYEVRGKRKETFNEVINDKEVKRAVRVEARDGKYILIDGINRVEAAKQLGLKTVPAIFETIEPETKPTEPKPRFAKKEPTAKLPQTSRKAERLDEKQSVEVATKIMPKKPSIPALGTFSVKDGIMFVTDLEIGTRFNTGIKDGIYKAVGKEAIPTQEVSQEDFPIVPEVKGEPMFKLTTDNFNTALKQAIKSVDKKGMRIEITGVSIKSDGKKIEMRATDSFRLYKKTLPAKTLGTGKFIVSNPDKLEKVIVNLGALTETTLNDKKDTIKFSGDNGEIVVRNIEGDFPDTSNVYPEFEMQYSFKKKDLLNAIKELKPFVKNLSATYRGIEIDYDAKNRKLNFTTVGEVEGKKKKVSVDAYGKKVEIPEGIENDGVVIMPIQPNAKTFTLDVGYIEDALNSLENDDTYLYLPKELTRPALFTENDESEMIPVGYKRGKDISIKKGTKLFHGTDANSASSIIQDGLNKTDDKTATYGRAIYLTPDYTTAQDYANETKKGQVITIIPDRDLKLYQPTTTEREDLVDKVGDDQDEFIKQLLGDDYDGFYIPDDGRGDGGEQVILYDDSLKFLYNAVPADEVKKETNKTAVSAKSKRTPSGIASAGGNNIGSFEDLSGVEAKTENQLKLYEEVKNLIKKYAKTIGEDYLPRNALGVYYPNTTNIRIKGMNDVSVAAHEITHFLDFAYKISDLLTGIKGYSIAGKPIYESETYQLRKEMTALYEQYYPGGKKTHKLRKRMLEGFATLLQKYTEQPTSITAQYPNLVKDFLTPEGKFYKPVIGDIMKDLKDIVSRYQGLEALDKIGARVINDKVNVNKDSFLGFWAKLKTEIADNIYPIEKLAKKAGVHFTEKDPSLWLRQYNSSNALIMNNINGNRGYWGWRNGELVKLHDFNWKDLIKDIKKSKTAEQFGYYLVARREYFMFQELKKLDENDPERIKLQQIINNDGFTEQEVEEAYLQNKDRFAEMEEKYDILVQEDLNFLHDPQVQLLDNEDFNRISSQEGYASFKRYFYDEVAGEEEAPIGRIRFGTTKVSSLLQRTGSKKPIINPLFSALRNHAEIMRKGMKQTIYNRVGAISEKMPDLFQRLQLKGIPDRQGKIMFPQEKDPNIIMARFNFKRVPILTDNTIKRTIDEVLTYQNISIFEKLLMGSSRFFTKGTTGLFPGFALTNYTVDQLTGTAQTRNKYTPLYDPLRELFTAARYKDSEEHKYLQEYLVMGGERQTMVGWQDMSPNELFDTIARERKGLLKVVDGLNKGMNIFALPAKWSEIMTRATEYIKSRESGKSQIVALEEAGRVTAPFHHIGRFGGGRVGRTYIKSIPFFNPGIQVLAQAIETLETPKGRARYAFVSLAVVAASIGGLALILSKGTDEQKDLFADINPDELNKYIWLPDPDGKDLIKIRVPDQMNVFATLINMMIADKKLNANYTAGEYLNAGMSWLPQQIDISQPTRALLSWIPQIIKPGVLTIAGVKDFPKIMPLESQMQQSKSPGLRATESTSPVAKWLGKTFNLSPIKIDYLLTGYAGRATGFLTGKPGIYNPFKSMQRQYYFSSGRKVQQFYDMKEKNDQDYYDYKHKLKEFKLGERTEIIKQRSKLNAVSDLIGQYRDVDTDKSPEKAEKLRNRILDKINEL